MKGSSGVDSITDPGIRCDSYVLCKSHFGYILSKSFSFPLNSNQITEFTIKMTFLTFCMNIWHIIVKTMTRIINKIRESKFVSFL